MARAFYCQLQLLATVSGNTFERELAMPDLRSSDRKAVPSARAERRRIMTDDAAGIAAYLTAIALITAIVVAVVILA